MENQEQDIKINTLEIMMKQNSKEHTELKEMITGFGDKLDKSLEKMEKKFAPMWVKNAIVWAGGIVGTFLILYALNKLFI